MTLSNSHAAACRSGSSGSINLMANRTCLIPQLSPQQTRAVLCSHTSAQLRVGSSLSDKLQWRHLFKIRMIQRYTQKWDFFMQSSSHSHVTCDSKKQEKLFTFSFSINIPTLQVFVLLYYCC